MVGTEHHEVTVWDVSSLTRVMALPGHYEGVYGLAHSEDGRFIGTADGLCAVRLWDANSGRLLRQWGSRGREARLSFSPDGQRLAAISSRHSTYGFDVGMVELWDVRTGRQLLVLDQHTDPGATIEFSPDGLCLATGGTDFRICQAEAFPWDSVYYPNGVPPADALNHYARSYWQRRVAAELADLPDSDINGSVVKLPFDRRSIPPRDPRATDQQLDLTAHYTNPFNETFHPAFNLRHLDHDLRELPHGLAELAGITWDVRGVIQLRPGTALQDIWRGLWALNWESFPDGVTDIQVRPFRQIHLLHGGVLSHGKPADVEGKAVAALICHYADGAQAEFEIVYGRHLREWEEQPGSTGDVSDGQVAWRGSNPAARDMGISLRLYQSSWVNPRPDVPVTSIDYVSRKTAFAPFLVAITVE
jgi:hypothetical protein